MNLLKKIIPLSIALLALSCSNNNSHKPNPESTPVTGVSLNFSYYELEVDNTLQLLAEITPSDASNQNVTWSVTKGANYASVSSTGLVTGLSEGDATVTVTTVDGHKTASCDIKVEEYVDPTTESYVLFSEDKLAIGSNVIFASGNEDSIQTMSTNQKNFNRGTAETVVENESIFPALKTAIFRVEEGLFANTYAFYDEINDGYIYAGHSERNQLKTETEISENSSFSFTNNEGIVRLQAQGSNARNIIKYNSRDVLFSCYYEESTVGELPYLFYKPGQLIYPDSISISGDSEITINEQTKLSVTYSPSKTNKKVLSWESSNIDVASVTSRGVITGLKEGTSTITCYALKEDGSYATSSFDIEVVKIPVTGISLNRTESELTAGHKLQLSATISPSDASYQGISWKSSNTSIATVDNSGLVSVKDNAPIGSTVTITATSVDNDEISASCVISIAEFVKDDHTVLIYMCGSNLESSYSYQDEGLATMDIAEILEVTGQPDDVNIVIETGGAYGWSSTFNIDSDYLQRWHVENQELILDESLDYQSMGNPNTLQSFVEYGLNNYPADRVGLIMWNHGGAMRGCCYDEKAGDDSILTNEMATAISGALDNCGMSGEKLEWVGYDCCLMQVQDIASINSDYFNYMIASEESEAGYGWDYDNWVDELYAQKTTPEILTSIVDTFIEDNGGADAQSSFFSSADQTLSYLNLNKMNAYISAWENMSKALSNKLTSSNRSSFKSLITSCQSFAGSDYDYYGIFDAKDFLNKLAANSTFNPGSSYTNAALAAFDELVEYSIAQKGAPRAYGLALFWSVSSYCEKGRYYLESMTKLTNWRSLVTTYGY